MLKMLTKGGHQKTIDREIGRLKMHRLLQIYKYTQTKKHTFFGYGGKQILTNTDKGVSQLLTITDNGKRGERYKNPLFG